MTLQNNDNIDSIEQQQEPAQESSKASVQSIDARATYSPDDNKLRLYPVERLDRETYERVKKYGFIWAAVQKCFVAPAWSPEREDLLTQLVGEIGDEDTSLLDRAEERAERFGGYSERRRDEACSKREQVRALADGIPLGQPILIGHHSEARARKDAEKIHNGMLRAVSLWNTAQYWTDRAAGAVSLAKYKERSDVRARRIKRIEADLRKQQRIVKESTTKLALWAKVDTIEKAEQVANIASVTVLDGSTWGVSLWSLIHDRKIELADAIERANRAFNRSIARASRWIGHYEMRLSYERAMLAEAGGLAGTKHDIQPGGMVLVGGEWLTVLRVTRRNGEVQSVTTNARYVPRKGIELVKDYRAPEAEQAEAVAKATKLPPLVNYPGEDFDHMTTAEFKALGEWGRFIRKVAATDTAGAHRQRFRNGQGYKLRKVFLTDAKRVDPPSVAAPAPALPREPVAAPVASRPAAQPDTDGAEFQAMEKALRKGEAVQVVTAPQLFPTPSSVAADMVSLACIGLSDRVLEPSAGTGAILDAIEAGRCRPMTVEAVEVDPRLCQRLRETQRAGVRCADFLSLSPADLGGFHRILMNPPFANAADIAHIKHALTFLNPGGVLVAICADGPRQSAQLRELAELSGGTWEPLPEGTFANAGTNVRTVLLSIHA
jgi:predicted RNA methylase